MNESPDRAIAKSHIIVLTRYLSSFPAKSSPQIRSVARQRLSTLTDSQFKDLTLDVYDELVRRLDTTYKASAAPFLPARRDYAPSRNEARRNMAKIPELGYSDLCGDVLYELERRHPDLKPILHRKATNDTLVNPNSPPPKAKEATPPPDPVITEYPIAKQHFGELSIYLASYLAKPHPDPSRSPARLKLARLPNSHFLELSTDVYDEVMRRSRSSPALSFLPANRTFEPQRNEARKKMALMPESRVQILSCDVRYELRRRWPELQSRDTRDARDSSRTLVNETPDNRMKPQPEHPHPQLRRGYTDPGPSLPPSQYRKPMQQVGEMDLLRTAKYTQQRRI